MLVDHTDAADPAMPFAETPNVGREAPAYLSWIIEHYDNLPDRTVFIHGHRTSW